MIKAKDLLLLWMNLANEANCTLLCSTAAGSNNIFIGKDLSEVQNFPDNNIKDYDGNNLRIDFPQSNGESICRLASMREITFAFCRAAGS